MPPPTNQAAKLETKHIELNGTEMVLKLGGVHSGITRGAMLAKVPVDARSLDPKPVVGDIRRPECSGNHELSV